ncbi:hypothetical protein [Acidovorax sp. A79]|uniref:hypothetical protein n=1 Tax=Acidovorax sp. A79 TaxID=3056107 RepID=UPI0034E8DB87
MRWRAAMNCPACSSEASASSSTGANSCQQCTMPSHTVHSASTPAAFKRAAMVTASSRKRSQPPTCSCTGGRPCRSAL